MERLEAIKAFCRRTKETGESVVELIVTENTLSATVTDDTLEVIHLEYNDYLNEWE